jgi:hypothetical protein
VREPVETMDEKCRHCEKTAPEVTLHKCQICFKFFCDDDAVQTSGVSFCSAGCGEYFFFIDPDHED